MIFEDPQKVEQISKSKERLLSLEKEGKYVFHGSSDIIEILEPRQAYNDKNGQRKKDGDPAVFATPYADVAIFRALVNSQGVEGESTSEFGMNKEQLHFSATKNLLDQSRNKVGRIYVLDKQKFEKFEGTDCRSNESVAPIEVIEVNIGDLPKNIEIID